MPIPSPNKGESQEGFISRCHTSLASEYSDTKQRHAICMSSWRKNMKKWVKFLKDHNDGTTEFKKDLIVQVEEEVAKSLVTLKIAEDAKEPDNEIVNKMMGNLTETLVKKLEEGLTDVFDKVTKNIKEKKIFATPKDHNEEGKRGFNSVGEFATSLIKHFKARETDERLFKGTPSGQNTMVDDEGGILIPETFAAGIWEYVLADTEIYSKTDQRQTSGNSLKVTTVPITSRKDSSRHAGALAYWMDEADAYTSSVIRWASQRLELHKLGVLFYVTEEELADSAVALEPIFSRRAGQAINFKVNESFYNGTGTGQPQGVMNSEALIVVALEANQNVDTILHKNINKMYYRMHPSLRADAAWYCHPNLVEQLELITFNDETTAPTNPIYMPPGGLSTGPYGTLKGLPVVPFEYCYDFGQKGDILLANWSQYLTLRKAGAAGGIKSASSIHVRFLYDEQAFKFSFRIDGQSAWNSSLEDYRGTKTRSPFITLANRSGESSSSGL